MTPTQLLVLLAIGVIGLSLIVSVTVLVNGFIRFREQQQQDKSLLAKLDEYAGKEH